MYLRTHQTLAEHARQKHEAMMKKKICPDHTNGTDYKPLTIVEFIGLIGLVILLIFGALLYLTLGEMRPFVKSKGAIFKRDFDPIKKDLW